MTQILRLDWAFTECPRDELSKSQLGHHMSKLIFPAYVLDRVGNLQHRGYPTSFRLELNPDAVQRTARRQKMEPSVYITRTVKGLNYDAFAFRDVCITTHTSVAFICICQNTADSARH
jgi:hypothetical protein